MVYTFPERINMDNALTLQKELDRVLDQGEASGSNEFVFDFSQKPFLEPAGALMFSSIIYRFCEKHKKELQFKVKNDENTTYGRTFAFFERCFPPNIELSLSKKTGEGNLSYIPITEIDARPLSTEKPVINPRVQLDWPEIDEAAKNLSEILVQAPADSAELKNTDELKELFQYLFQEMLRNVPEHSNAAKSWVCGQFYPKKNEAEISVLDEGGGVYNSFLGTPAHAYIKKMGNRGALQWALVAGISRSFTPRSGQLSEDENANIGAGLYRISQICKELDGVFCMASGENYIEVEYDKERPTIGEADFQGTAIRIRINMSKLGNAKSFLKKIDDNEEKEAKAVREGFHNSAEPSQELIDRLGIQ